MCIDKELLAMIGLALEASETTLASSNPINLASEKIDLT